MRRFPVPFDLEFEDKIIGGKLSIRQAIWLGIPILVGFVGMSSPSIYMHSVNGVNRLLWGKLILFLLEVLILAIVSCIFAFTKKKGLTLDKYIFKSIKYKLSRNVIKHYE